MDTVPLPRRFVSARPSSPWNRKQLLPGILGLVEQLCPDPAAAIPALWPNPSAEGFQPHASG